MAIFDKVEQSIQEREDFARDAQRYELWTTQVRPKFVNAGLTKEQIEAAKSMFCRGFDAGWESHRAFLMNEFIQDNQKNKVHLA